MPNISAQHPESGFSFPELQTNTMLRGQEKQHAMSKLVVSSYIGGGDLWLYLDGAMVVRNSDAVEILLKEETSYFLHWFVEGEPGTAYSITISSPREAQFQLTKLIGSGRKEGGNFYFKG